MSTATITSKGQLTLPKAIREALGLGPGDKVTFVEMEDGNYAVMPAKGSVKRLKGLLAGTGRIASLEDMDQAIAEGAKAR
ncbi:MAG: AbrB/MazE/SpoVT family DNA-binding domain-containing protein [Henriciella sp.]|nr:AbrB/MazE/SpoVT family DNA-binding domain-containing protein [Henriciella sp.]